MLKLDFGMLLRMGWTSSQYLVCATSKNEIFVFNSQGIVLNHFELPEVNKKKNNIIIIKKYILKILIININYLYY
jgi:hypothetical protein